MGDEDHGQFHILHQFLKQVQYLRLDGDIQSGDGFVCDDEFGRRGQCPGDGDALTLPTGEFMRILESVLGVKSDALHEGLYFSRCFFFIQRGGAL